MPSGAIHRLIDKMLFGNEGNDVHKWMDAPAKWAGPNHRKFRHDLTTLIALYILNGEDGVQHGVSHIFVDKFLSKGYNELKKQINNVFQGILKI